MSLPPILYFQDWRAFWKAGLAQCVEAAHGRVSIGAKVTSAEPALELCRKIASCSSVEALESLLSTDPVAANEFLRYILSVDKLVEEGGCSAWQFTIPPALAEECPFLIFCAVANSAIEGMRDLPEP